MKTLAELNVEITAKLDTYDWGQYTIQHGYAVGQVGFRRTGTKVHLLRIATVIEERGEHKPGTKRVGDIYRAHAPCNGNGQHVGQVLAGRDTNAITCEKCLAYLS